MSVAIVIVNFNGWDDTQRCLRSLYQAKAEALIIVIDNASEDDRCAQLQSEFPGLIIQRNHRNGGWAGGNNAGIKLALAYGAESIILLNNDTIVAPDFVPQLARAAVANPSYGIIGPIINSLERPAELMTDGCQFNRRGRDGFMQRVPVPTALGNHDVPPAEVEIVNGCAMLIRRSVIESIGLIDERFFLVHEESDFCLRARRAGFRCGILPLVLVWHKGSSSFQRTGKKLQRYYDSRNLLLLLCKHPNRPGQRSRLPALLAYLRYIYHRYQLEREGGSAESAQAVVDGFYDGIRRWYGPRSNMRRLGVSVLRGCFNAAAWVRQHIPMRQGV